MRLYPAELAAMSLRGYRLLPAAFLCLRLQKNTKQTLVGNTASVAIPHHKFVNRGLDDTIAELLSQKFSLPLE
jgi:hypothetical protein